MHFNPVHIIKKKRDGHRLTGEEITQFISGYLSGEVKEYQMSALLMAIYFNGLNDDETLSLTKTFIESGEQVDLSFINKPKIDKHSTGGVGDKTSLILAPLIACFDITVPMISGRGLGHTGGTLDKLESIHGFRTNLSVDEFKQILSKINVCMIGQTESLTPADKKIYALRDVTATVENIGLITASIISKKIAEGADGIVFNVQVGNGSTLPTAEKSRELAMKLLEVTRKFGKKAIAILTEMDSPLGYAIGNWAEIKECLEIMNPIVENNPLSNDLLEVTLTLAGGMLLLGGKCKSIEDGIELAKGKLKSQEVNKKFFDMVTMQGGDLISYNKTNITEYIKSDKDGYIENLDALSFGLAAVDLGCGRKHSEDKIDYRSSIILKKKPGDKIKMGEVICEVSGQTETKIKHALHHLEKAITISDNPVKIKSKILEIID